MGDKNRIIRAKDKKISDPEFETLLKISPEKLRHNLSPFFTRPAYQYTKSEVGSVSDIR